MAMHKTNIPHSSYAPNYFLYDHLDYNRPFQKTCMLILQNWQSNFIHEININSTNGQPMRINRCSHNTTTTKSCFPQLEKEEMHDIPVEKVDKH